MNRILCRFAQLRLDSRDEPTGWLARHLDSCSECRAVRGQARTLARQLRSDPPPCDDVFCDALMTRIEASKTDGLPAFPSRSSVARHPWLLGIGSLAATAAIVIGVVALTEPKSSPRVESPAVVVRDEPARPDPGDGIQSLAHMLEQQELLRRDAGKLGAHLRERVILFRPVE